MNVPTLASLSPEQKRQVLAELLAKRTQNAPARFPLSFNQKSMWYLYRFAPDSPAYNARLTADVGSAVDVELLKQACDYLVRRHEILRTVYGFQGAESLQEVLPEMPVDFAQLAAAGLSDEKLTLRIDEESNRHFDLERGPILRVRLFTRSTSDHRLLLVIHHIAIDFWSFMILADNLCDVYAALLRSETPELPGIARAYKDHAELQRQMLDSVEGARLWEFWSSELSGDLLGLNLPSDRPRPATRTFRGASHRFVLDSNLISQLQRLARQANVTLYMVFLTAFEVLLHRYSGQDNIVLASPTSGRTSIETEQTIGYFVNPVLLRSKMEKGASFRQLLEQVKETVLGAMDHQQYPLALLVEKLRPTRDPSRSPIADVVFSWDRPQKVKEKRAAGLCLENLKLQQMGAAHDLMMVVFENADTLDLVLQYSTDLFDAETMVRMAAHFRAILREIVADPAQRVDRIPLLAQEERDQQLIQWANTKTEYPHDKSIQELFEEQANSTPDATALVFGEQQLTYAELNRRANQIAWHLRKLGVGPDVLVGLCMERSLEMVVAILAIIKSGGAYAPLDPSYPEDRLRFMIEDTRTPVLLSETVLAARLPSTNALIICPDREGDEISHESTENPPAMNRPGDLVYVMYTSGSTGRQKGVAVPHRAVVRLVKATNYAIFSHDETFLLFAPISFDASTLEIWGASLNGARLVIAPPRQLALDELGKVIAESQVSIVWLTAGLFHLTVEHQLESLKSVRQLLAGGDVLSPSHVERALRALPGCTVINGYGPTENTTFTCCYSMTDPKQVGTSVPIGFPIANTQVYILDGYLEPVPVGVVGELYAGGDGLARGYWNNVELTEEKFVRNPFSNDSEARLYKTGDLARFRPDGCVEFLGRNDQQVKIRGFRVEPGEIEAILGQHPGIRECAVLANEDKSRQKTLVAYFVPRASEVTTAEIVGFLKQRLPNYMIPSAFVSLIALPLNANGKVDRGALPTPKADSAEPESCAPPQTEIEHTIAGVWRRALKAERIGRNENFFDLGAHSLLVAQVHAELCRELKRDLLVVHLFQYPNVSSLAKFLTQQKPETLTFSRLRDQAVQKRLAMSRMMQAAKQSRRADE